MTRHIPFRYVGKPEPLTALVSEMYSAMQQYNSHLQLSFALGIFPASQSASYNHKDLAQYLDFLIPMAYDEPWGAKSAAANSPIDAIKTGVAQYATLGVPASKLVIGLPWYGWDYPCDSNRTGIVCNVTPPAGQEWYGWATQIVYSDTMKLLDGNTVMTREYVDNKTTTKYFDYNKTGGSERGRREHERELGSKREGGGNRSIRDGGRHQIWFDDPMTLEAKYSLCASLQTHGVAFWTADFVDYSTHQGADMWAAINKGFPPSQQ